MPEQDQPPERGRALRRALKTRQRLLESALSIFTQQGVDACSIEDITERADVGKGTFYRHFDDKQAILSVLTQSVLQDLSGALREHMAAAPSLPEALARVQASETEWCGRRADGFRLLLQVQALLIVRPQAAASLRTSLRDLITDVTAMLRPLTPPQTDDATLRQAVLEALSTPLGALALQQAVGDGRPDDTAETQVIVAAAPPPFTQGAELAAPLRGDVAGR